MKKLTAMLAGFAMAATVPTLALAGIGEEITIAKTHSLLAYRSGGRGPERAMPHLQHVLNCLVGPGGDGYDITPPNTDPCANAGKGALNDAANPAQKAKITQAIGMVKAAMKLTEGEKIELAATEIADLLDTANQ
jgi:hypothetical protein